MTCGDPGSTKCARTRTACAAGAWPYQNLFPTSCSWWSGGLFVQSFSIAFPFQSLWGLPCLGSFSVVWHIRHTEGAPLDRLLLCRLAHQSLKGAQWVGSCSVVQWVRHLMDQPLYCSAADAGLWGERGYGDGSTLLQWLSSIALLPWLPGLPPQPYPTTISSLTFPRSAFLQSTAALALGLLHNPYVPSSQLLRLLGDLHPSLGCVWLWQGLILIAFRLPQISCFTLSLKCFSSDPDSCSHVGIGHLLQFSHPPGAGPVLLTLLFSPLVPSSYQVLSGSIYSFPLVRYSRLLSAAVLQALLCLNVYSSRIRGERCTPRPPTPLPCCSSQLFDY